MTIQHCVYDEHMKFGAEYLRNR